MQLHIDACTGCAQDDKSSSCSQTPQVCTPQRSCVYSGETSMYGEMRGEQNMWPSIMSRLCTCHAHTVRCLSILSLKHKPLCQTRKHIAPVRRQCVTSNQYQRHGYLHDVSVFMLSSFCDRTIDPWWDHMHCFIRDDCVKVDCGQWWWLFAR